MITATLVVAFIPLYAENAVITFVKGKPEIKSGGKAIDAKLGTELPLSSVITTPGKSSISLKYKGMQMRIKKADKVKLQDLLEKENSTLAEESNFLNNILQPPASAAPKMAPTKVAGIRGKSGGAVAGKGAATDANPNSQYYDLISKGEFKQVLESIKAPKSGEEHYILGLAHYGNRSPDNAEQEMLAATKAANPDPLRVKIEVSLASIYMAGGEYKKSIERLQWVEKNVLLSFITPEVWYLLVKSNEYAANDAAADQYRQKIKQYYPDHKLTKLVSK